MEDREASGRSDACSMTIRRWLCSSNHKGVICFSTKEYAFSICLEVCSPRFSHILWRPGYREGSFVIIETTVHVNNQWQPSLASKPGKKGSRGVLATVIRWPHPKGQVLVRTRASALPRESRNQDFYHIFLNVRYNSFKIICWPNTACPWGWIWSLGPRFAPFAYSLPYKHTDVQIHAHHAVVT